MVRLPCVESCRKAVKSEGTEAPNVPSSVSVPAITQTSSTLEINVSGTGKVRSGVSPYINRCQVL